MAYQLLKNDGFSRSTEEMGKLKFNLKNKKKENEEEEF